MAIFIKQLIRHHVEQYLDGIFFLLLALCVFLLADMAGYGWAQKDPQSRAHKVD